MKMDIRRPPSILPSNINCTTESKNNTNSIPNDFEYSENENDLELKSMS